MDWELKEYNYKFFRIHASGDFFGADYVRAWIEIIRNNPQVSFWSYTKAYGHGFDAELDELNALPNCNIVPSIVEGFGYNYGHCGYVLDMYESLKASGEDVYICPCGTDDTVHCNKCHGCAEHKYVLFLEHSTGYKAVEDPQYIDIKELVARQ